MILWTQPGQAKLTKGFHDLSVDCMNTSFSLVSHKSMKYSPKAKVASIF